MNFTIRSEAAEDLDAIWHVNRCAFGQADESELVNALGEGGYARVSLVAEVNGVVVGHILFSDLPILAFRETVAALSLAPMAVLPGYQHQGIGSALVRQGLEACRQLDRHLREMLRKAAHRLSANEQDKLANSLLQPEL